MNVDVLEKGEAWKSVHLSVVDTRKDVFQKDLVVIETVWILAPYFVCSRFFVGLKEASNVWNECCRCCHRVGLMQDLDGAVQIIMEFNPNAFAC